jgi:hypothetical protein
MKEFTLFFAVNALGNLTTKIFEIDIDTNNTISDKEKEDVYKLNVNEGCTIHFGSNPPLKGWITRTK